MQKLLLKIKAAIIKPYLSLKARTVWDKAVRQAEETHMQTGQRIYVIKSRGKGKKKFLLVDRSNFRKLKQMGYINKRATIKSLESYCFYCTAYINGKDAMPPEIAAMKRKEAIRWYIS